MRAVWGIVVALVVCAEAWGRSGHRITAMIAQPLLNPKATAWLQKALGQTDLYSPSKAYPNGPINWPDSYDHTSAGQWSYDVHFAYTDLQPFFTYDCDCRNVCTSEDKAAGVCSQLNETLLDCCVVAGIEKYRDELFLQIVKGETNATAEKGNTASLTIQTMLLAHFAGDIHQPLHVALYNDRGGNSFLVRFFGNETCGYPPDEHHCQLHEVWDSLLIDRKLTVSYGAYNPDSHGVDKRELEYASNIAARFALIKDMTLSRQEVYEWATESVSLAAMAYLNDPDFNVDEHYFIHSQPTIEQQLYKAGLRIAQLLNLVVGASGDCPLCSWKAPLCRPAGFLNLPAECNVPNSTSSDSMAKFSYFRNNKLW